MDLVAINFIICSIAGFACLFVLVTTKIDTKHWRRLFIVCFTGLAYTVWLLSGMVNPALRVEDLIGRTLILIAFGLWVLELYEINGISHILRKCCRLRRKRDVN